MSTKKFNSEKDDTVPSEVKVFCSNEEVVEGKSFIPRGVSIHYHLCVNDKKLKEIMIFEATIKSIKEKYLIDTYKVAATIVFLKTCKYIEVRDKTHLIPDMKKLKKVKFIFEDKTFLIGVIYVPNEVRRLSDLIREENKNFILVHTDENFGKYIHHYVYLGDNGHQVRRVEFL